MMAAPWRPWVKTLSSPLRMIRLLFFRIQQFHSSNFTSFLVYFFSFSFLVSVSSFTGVMSCPCVREDFNGEALFSCILIVEVIFLGKVVCRKEVFTRTLVSFPRNCNQMTDKTVLFMLFIGMIYANCIQTRHKVLIPLPL